MIEFNPPASADVTHVRPGECTLGDDCEQLGAGHSLSFMQRRLAGATPSKWRDAIVNDVSANGRLRLTALADNTEIALWHHSEVGQLIRVGEPVAVHEVYHVLAVGPAWFNVAAERL